MNKCILNKFFVRKHSLSVIQYQNMALQNQKTIILTDSLAADERYFKLGLTALLAGRPDPVNIKLRLVYPSTKSPYSSFTQTLLSFKNSIEILFNFASISSCSMTSFGSAENRSFFEAINFYRSASITGEAISGVLIQTLVCSKRSKSKGNALENPITRHLKIATKETTASKAI